MLFTLLKNRHKYNEGEELADDINGNGKIQGDTVRGIKDVYDNG